MSEEPQVKEPRYRCTRCRNEGSQAELDKYFCSDIPVTCFVARESMHCARCDENYDDMNDWTGEPEYDGEPGPGSGVCRECKETLVSWHGSKCTDNLLRPVYEGDQFNIPRHNNQCCEHLVLCTVEWDRKHEAWMMKDKTGKIISGMGIAIGFTKIDGRKTPEQRESEAAAKYGGEW